MRLRWPRLGTVILLAALLGVGVVVNVGVAWGLVLWGPVKECTDAVDDRIRWPIRPDGWPDRGSESSIARGPGLLYTFYAPEYELTDHPLSPRFMFITYAGWPLHSVWGGWGFGIGDLGPRVKVGRVPALRNLTRSDNFSRDELPIRPLPVAFAVNTLFYAALLWLLIAGEPALRRAVRRWRGWCGACGYDRRGLGAGVLCPECGAG